MTGQEPKLSRVGRKKDRNRSNIILNVLIGVVVVLIIIVGATIFIKTNGEQADEKEVDTTEEIVDVPSDREEQPKDTEDGNMGTQEDDEENRTELPGNGDSNTSEESSPDHGSEMLPNGDSVISVPSDDEVVVETITNPAWQPIGTTQTGEHVSQYDGESVDWAEKQQALAYATGLPQDSMIFWRIKNGGSPQKSVGIVSSRDSVEKYRVYLEWVDGQGWKPVKMDVLKTLDFDY